MNDLISRKALVRALIAEREKYPPETTERYSFGAKVPCRFNQAIRGGIRKALREIEMAPAVDVAPVAHGRWIKGKKEKLYCDWEMNGWYDYPVKCSVCKYDATEYGTGETNYCPNCGAKMDKEEPNE